MHGKGWKRIIHTDCILYWMYNRVDRNSYNFFKMGRPKNTAPFISFRLLHILNPPSSDSFQSWYIGLGSMWDWGWYWRLVFGLVCKFLIFFLFSEMVSSSSVLLFDLLHPSSRSHLPYLVINVGWVMGIVCGCKFSPLLSSSNVILLLPLLLSLVFSLLFYHKRWISGLYLIKW